MLPKDQRLRLRKDFSKVYRLGTTYQDKFLKLLICFESDAQQLVGFVVSKKVSKKAVIRNRIKRQLREAYRQQDVNFATGFKMIWIAKVQLNGCSFTQILESVKYLLQLATYEQKDFSVHH